MSHAKLTISQDSFAKQNLKSMLDQLPIVMLMVDRTGRVDFFNKEAQAFFGAHFFTSTKITQLFQQFSEYDFNHTIKQFSDDSNKEKKSQFSISFFLQQKTYTASLSMTHYSLHNSNDIVYIFTIIDIQSEHKDKLLKKNFKELKQFARLSAMREISSSLADKLNQPLTAILSYTQAMQRLYKANASTNEINDAMERVVVNAENAGQIIKQVRAGLNVNTLNYQSSCINKLIQESIYLTELGNPDTPIKLTTHFEKQNSLLNFDKLQMRQVIFSLLNNAIDAVMERSDHSAEIIVQTQLKQQNKNTHFEIIIADNGFLKMSR
jgi:C4-dicarboxylate-specific signal transduction histidine kinase